MKIRPNEASAPLQSPAIGGRCSTSANDARLFAKMIDTAISANAISPAGNRPATNNPPIDKLATKPRMIKLMQGGMVSAITAEAASNATAPPGFCRERRGAGGRHHPTPPASALLAAEVP